EPPGLLGRVRGPVGCRECPHGARAETPMGAAEVFQTPLEGCDVVEAAVCNEPEVDPGTRFLGQGSREADGISRRSIALDRLREVLEAGALICGLVVGASGQGV